MDLPFPMKIGTKMEQDGQSNPSIQKMSGVLKLWMVNGMILCAVSQGLLCAARNVVQVHPQQLVQQPVQQPVQQQVQQPVQQQVQQQVQQLVQQQVQQLVQQLVQQQVLQLVQQQVQQDVQVAGLPFSQNATMYLKKQSLGKKPRMLVKQKTLTWSALPVARRTHLWKDL